MSEPVTATRGSVDIRGVKVKRRSTFADRSLVVVVASDSGGAPVAELLLTAEEALELAEELSRAAYFISATPVVGASS